jgi:hypothetical protein
VNEEEWNDWALNSRRGATFIPRDPKAAYAQHGWVCWVGQVALRVVVVFRV